MNIRGRGIVLVADRNFWTVMHRSFPVHKKSGPYKWHVFFVRYLAVLLFAVLTNKNDLTVHPYSLLFWHHPDRSDDPDDHEKWCQEQSLIS